MKVCRKGRRPAALFLNLMAVLAVAVLVVIALKTDFSAIGHHMGELPQALVVSLFLLQIVTQLSLNFQWLRLCRVLGLKASFWSLLVVNAYGTVVDAANPGEKVGGEVARVIQLQNMLGFNTNQATSLVTIQKSLSLSALIILNGLAVFVLGDSIPLLAASGARVVILGLLAALTVLLVYALFFTEHLNRKVQGWRSEGKVAKWLKQWMADFARDTAAIAKKPGEWVLQFVLSLAIWTLFPLKLQLIVSHYGAITPLVLFAITFVAYFAAMVPLLPGGLGTFEAAMGGMLAASGLTWEQALAISLIFRFITFWFVVALSALLIAADKLPRLVRKNPR